MSQQVSIANTINNFTFFLTFLSKFTLMYDLVFVLPSLVCTLSLFYKAAAATSSDVRIFLLHCVRACGVRVQGRFNIKQRAH